MAAETNGNGHDPSGSFWPLAFGEEPPPPKTARGTKVQLADGHEWLLPPPRFFDLQVQPELAPRAFADLNWTNATARENAIALIRACLERNYPGITPNDLAERLDYKAAVDCLKIVWVENGLQLRDLFSAMGLSPPNMAVILAPAEPPTGAAPTPGS